MELGHLLTRSGLTYPEVSSKVCHDSFCQLGNSVSLSWVIYYETFYLHVVSSLKDDIVQCNFFSPYTLFMSVILGGLCDALIVSEYARRWQALSYTFDICY